MLDLADSPHVSLKVSPHVLRSSGDDPARLVDQLVERFGAGRLLWGSDYPQSEHDSYGQLVELGEGSFRHLAPASRRRSGERTRPLFGLEAVGGS